MVRTFAEGQLLPNLPVQMVVLSESLLMVSYLSLLLDDIQSHYLRVVPSLAESEEKQEPILVPA